MGKKKQINNFPFESASASGGKFTKICEDMMKSKAWEELSLRQRGLYLELKRKFTKKRNHDTNENNISMAYSEYSKLYGDKRTFWNDIDKLIDNGFIKVIEHGKITRTPNIYGFSSKWHKFGTDEYFVPLNEKRITKKN